MSLENLKWRANDYNVKYHNCQCYIVKLIELMNAVRFEGKDYRGFHHDTVLTVPKALADALEKNEGDKETRIGKIPIIGGFYDFGRGLKDVFTNDDDHFTDNKKYYSIFLDIMKKCIFKLNQKINIFFIISLLNYIPNPLKTIE